MEDNLRFAKLLLGSYRFKDTIKTSKWEIISNIPKKEKLQIGWTVDSKRVQGICLSSHYSRKLGTKDSRKVQFRTEEYPNSTAESEIEQQQPMKTNIKVFQTTQIHRITFFSKQGPRGQEIIPQMPLMGFPHGTAILCCHVHTTAAHDTRAEQIPCSASTWEQLIFCMTWRGYFFPVETQQWF